MEAPSMGHTDEILCTVRKSIDAHPEALSEARSRTRLVRSAGFAVTPGALRHYGSGSLEQHTQNHPINDGDAGLVLNRVHYPRLGPDGRGEAPTDVVNDICKALGPKIRETYPNAGCGTSKRGPKISVGSPIDDQDPTVDLVIALTRRDGSGLWIPNLEKGTWEASDPEQHCALLNAVPATLRSTRRKVIRHLKAWNKQFSEPVFSSFHLSVLALEFVVPGRSVAGTLLDVFGAIAKRMDARGATKDPAGVSANIRLLGTWDQAERRTRFAAGHLWSALDHDSDSDDSGSRDALGRLYWKYLEQPDALAATIARLGMRRPVPTSALGLGGSVGLVAVTRAYGALGEERPGR
jgi:hypothetical protein